MGDKDTNVFIPSLIISAIIFWIFSLPLLFTSFHTFAYLGFWLTAGFGIFYLWQRKQPLNTVAFLSITMSKGLQRIAWIVWGLFFAVCFGITMAISFGSDIWFGRPFHISRPYQMADIAARVYLPLLTIIVPITFRNLTSLLLKNRKEYNRINL